MGKQFNKKFNNHQRKPYQKNDNKKSFNNRKGNEGFIKNKQNFTAKGPKVNLKEDQVGITEYVNSGKGFMGILKSRFSDFHVNEIDLCGKVLQLNDLAVPEQKEEELSTEEFNLAREDLKDVITEDIWNNIKELAASKMDNTTKPEDSAVYVEVSELDKEKRTQVHKVIKKLYEGNLVSTTVGGDQLDKEADKKFIRVMKSKGRDRNRWTFPEEYVHFLVHKDNMDTSEVAAAIAIKLNLRPSQVNYCGTKDKRAKTTQKFCIKKRTPRQIVGSVKFINAVKIGNFEFSKHVLKLGDLKGNRFRIALRNLSGEREHIETSLEKIKEEGFINYFGLQRFGNCSTIPTYEVGVALLKADYKLACELILKPRENDLPFLKSIRETWWKERDSKAAAAQFRSDRFIEKKLFDGLAQYGENDYAAALRKIPRNMLLLYPHAFQSLIFNNMASRRIKEFGLKLISGDLVYRNKDDMDIELEITEIPHDEEAEVDEEGEETEKETATATTTESTESLFKRKVKALTEEDIASGDYSIYDVVLPLPGHDITYPNNEVGSWYEEMLGKYELSSEKLKHNVKTFAMAGAYRKLLVKPMDMSWEFQSYATPEETLIISDWELFKGKNIQDFKVKDKEAKYEALLLDFGLPTSAYATMMLRELLKCDTSAATQTSLQQAAMNEAKTETVSTDKTKIEVEEKGETTEKEGSTDKPQPMEEEQKDVASTAEKRKASNEGEDDVKPTKITKDNEI